MGATVSPSKSTHRDEIPDPFELLRQHSATLNAINTPATHEDPRYELLSGALIWNDETDRQVVPRRLIGGGLRFIFAYRTSLMLGEPREEIKSVWEHGLKLFPAWVGFRPERRQATPKLLEIYRRGEISLRKCLRDLDHDVEEESNDGNGG